MRNTLALVLVASMFAAACGGEAPVPKPPETEPVAAADAAADMPPPAPTTVATADKPAEPPPPPPPAPAIALPKDTVKIALKGKKTATLELHADGSVTNGGKAAASMSAEGDIKDAKGAAVLSVKGDAVSTPGGTAVATFSGDGELASPKGDKLAIADDGALTWTAGGKGAPAGKAEGAGSAKRATLLAAWFVLSPPPADKPAAKDPPAKPAGKDTPAKPAGGDKPAPKKK